MNITFEKMYTFLSEGAGNIATFPEGQSGVQNAIDSLAYMGKGMLGIFIVTGIIILTITAISRIFNGKKEK